MALYRAGQADASHGFVESFNGRMRDKLLNKTMFRNLAHARIVIAAWVDDYNTERPHSALGYQTSADYARTLTTAIARPAPIGVNNPPDSGRSRMKNQGQVMTFLSQSVTRTI